jgi:hypothetical protein
VVSQKYLYKGLADTCLPKRLFRAAEGGCGPQMILFIACIVELFQRHHTRSPFVYRVRIAGSEPWSMTVIGMLRRLRTRGAFDKNGHYEFDCKPTATAGCFRLCQ